MAVALEPLPGGGILVGRQTRQAAGGQLENVATQARNEACSTGTPARAVRSVSLRDSNGCPRAGYPHRPPPHDVRSDARLQRQPPVTLNGELSAADVAAIAAGARVRARPRRPWSGSQRNREVLEQILSTGTPVYGISTGFGALVSNTVAPELQRHLQVNLLRSHAAGTGPELPTTVVRGAMAVRANGLLLGHSGVRPLVVRADRRRCSTRATCRACRSTGSLGASGDLAPSAHAFLPLLGEGQAFDPRRRRSSAAPRRSRALGLEPLELESKEGLALINGTHFMSAIGALLAVRVGRLLDAIDLVAAATIDALRGALPAFDAARPSPAAAGRPERQRRQHRRRAARLEPDRRARARRGFRTPTRCAARRRCTAPRARRCASSPSSCTPTSTR